MLTAIVGINWGDEGKGRMVDLLSENYDIVARYQGGNNAGHTVQNHLGKFILNLLPSGILRPDVVNVMGPGMVIDLQHLCGEIDRLRQAGISITPNNLKISDRAIICLPYHVQQDGLEEDRLGDAKYGSTRRGIAPVYGDKYLKKCIRMGDLLYPEAMKKRLRGIVEWKDLLIHDGYKARPHLLRRNHQLAGNLWRPAEGSCLRFRRLFNRANPRREKHYVRSAVGCASGTSTLASILLLPLLPLSLPTLPSALASLAKSWICASVL